MGGDKKSVGVLRELTVGFCLYFRASHRFSHPGVNTVDTGTLGPISRKVPNWHASNHFDLRCLVARDSLSRYPNNFYGGADERMTEAKC